MEEIIFHESLLQAGRWLQQPPAVFEWSCLPVMAQARRCMECVRPEVPLLSSFWWVRYY